MPTVDRAADLRDQQFCLAHHIRDPQHNPPPPGIEDRRLQIYRDLFYNNLESLLSNNFPVIRRTLGDTRWHALARAFLRDHRCKTPLFPEIGREFLRFLENRQRSDHPDPAYLYELAHYEWVELALEIDEANPAQVPHSPRGDLLAGIPVPSPVARALAYQWPVHQIGPDHIPAQPPAQPTFLLVRRGADGQVRFSQLSALTFRLLQRLDEFPELSGAEHLRALAVEAAAPDPTDFIRQGKQMLEQLRTGGAILGTRPTNARPPPRSDDETHDA